MSGTSYLDLNGTALEDNLAQLFEFLSNLGTERFDFSIFSTDEKREDLMKLYSVSIAPDPLAAVKEIYAESEATAERRGREREVFMELLSSDNKAQINSVLTGMTETLNMLKTHGISLDTDKARGVYEDLMDFEELSADEIREPHLIDKREVRLKQPERDRLQTMLFDKCEPFLSKEACNADLIAFFGDRKDDDFSENHENAVHALSRQTTRLNLARLYMLAEGEYSMEEISSQSEDMKKTKRLWGDKFCDMALSGDAERIGKSWAKMMQYLNAAKMPEVDFTNDESIATHYAHVKLLSNFSTDVTQGVEHNDKDIKHYISENLTPEEEKEYDLVHEGIGGISECMKIKMQEIASGFYSRVNNGRRNGFIFPLVGDDAQVLAASVLTSENIVENLNQTIMGAAGKSYSALQSLSDYSRRTYSGIVMESENFNIQNGIAKRYRDPEGKELPSISKPVNYKEEIPFGDFLKLSGTAKAESAVKKAIDAAPLNASKSGGDKKKGFN